MKILPAQTLESEVKGTPCASGITIYHKEGDFGKGTKVIPGLKEGIRSRKKEGRCTLPLFLGWRA